MASLNLNPERGLIFRILHRKNVRWFLRNGLHCRNSDKTDPDYVSIGNQELIERRHVRNVPVKPNGTLSDYIPFYFTPFSPMMYNIKTGYGGIRRRENEEIVILVSSLPRLDELKVKYLFTDRHAKLEAAEFYSSRRDLDVIDWPLLQDRDFRRDPNDPGKVERYQAEALVHRYMPVDAVAGIVCYDAKVRARLEVRVKEAGVSIKVEARTNWYFG